MANHRANLSAIAHTSLNLSVLRTRRFNFIFGSIRKPEPLRKCSSQIETKLSYPVFRWPKSSLSGPEPFESLPCQNFSPLFLKFCTGEEGQEEFFACFTLPCYWRQTQHQ